MKLTGKARQKFEKWLSLNSLSYKLGAITDYVGLRELYALPEAMQFGVYVDFADSVGCNVGINKYNDSEKKVDFIWFILAYDILERDFCKNRPEARTAAIEKFNEIYNKMN